jgi:hypothetical protein
MRRLLQRRVATLALLAGVLAAGPAAAVDETELKAAIVFNVLLFVDWPGSALPAAPSPVVLCVGPAVALRADLNALAGRDVRGHRLEVRDLAAPDAGKPCHAVFIDASDRRLASSLRAHSAAGAIVISDDVEAPNEFTAILLRRVGARIGFDINLQPLHESHVQLSSKLLRLARVVKE